MTIEVNEEDSWKTNFILDCEEYWTIDNLLIDDEDFILDKNKSKASEHNDLLDDECPF